MKVDGTARELQQEQVMGGKEGEVARRGRHDRLIKEQVHDPYVKRGKLVEPTLCPQCR